MEVESCDHLCFYSSSRDETLIAGTSRIGRGAVGNSGRVPRRRITGTDFGCPACRNCPAVGGNRRRHSKVCHLRANDGAGAQGGGAPWLSSLSTPKSMTSLTRSIPSTLNEACKLLNDF